MERDQALKFMHDLLRLMISKRGSDLFITAGFPPAIKIDGKITPQSNQTLSPQHTAELARSIMNDRQAAEFESTKECNFAISPTGIGRFRVNAFVQQGRIGCVLRTIQQKIPTFDELGMPPVLKDIAMTKRGLVIFVGGQDVGQGGVRLRAGQGRLGVGGAALVEDDDVARRGDGRVGNQQREDLEGVAAGAALGQQQRVGRATRGAANGHGQADGRSVRRGVAQRGDDVAALKPQRRPIERRQAQVNPIEHTRRRDERAHRVAILRRRAAAGRAQQNQ